MISGNARIEDDDQMDKLDSIIFFRTPDEMAL
jgi:hypothetical protein